MNTINLNTIRETAERYYREGDFYCSEAIIKTIKDVFKPACSDEVIAMASGFPVGIGGAGCTCGAVSGGVMALGLLFGRQESKDPKVDKAMALSCELHEVFRTKNKTLCCKTLTRGMTLGSDVHMEQCIRFTGEIAYETAKIICRELSLDYVG